MPRLLHALFLGLIGAGIVHIVILFLVPHYSVNDAWTRLSSVADLHSTVRLDKQELAGKVPLPADPFIEAAACRFDLADGPLHVHGEGSVPFWSMSVYDRNGLNVFSMSDRTTNSRALDFVVLTPAQIRRLRDEVPTGFGRSIFVETDAQEGIVVVRVFVPDETWRGIAAAFLEGMRCAPGFLQ